LQIFGKILSMTRYTNEQLKEVEMYAGLCFSPREIGIILGVSPDSFAGDCRAIAEVEQAYRRGALLTEAQVRKATIDLARGGSSAACADYRKLIVARDLEIKKDEGKTPHTGS
jgi:hypothetical protein